MHLLAVSVLLTFAFPFIISELDSFSTCLDIFSNGKPPVIHDILENSVSKDQNRYKLICQGPERSFFATLYDTQNKIPIFSAYKYTGKGSFTRPKINFTTEKKLTNEQQAQDDDYKNNGINMSRGHLFPSSHAPDLQTAKSTFILTNIVPQEEHFNNKQWNEEEEKFKEYMDENCLNSNKKVEAHVLTGAIPDREKKMKNKVNIPSHMWMALCCYNNEKNLWVSKAYCATNEANSIAVPAENLDALQKFMKDKWEKVVLLYDNCK